MNAKVLLGSLVLMLTSSHQVSVGDQPVHDPYAVDPYAVGEVVVAGYDEVYDGPVIMDGYGDGYGAYGYDCGLCDHVGPPCGPCHGSQGCPPCCSSCCSQCCSCCPCCCCCEPRWTLRAEAVYLDRTFGRDRTLLVDANTGEEVLNVTDHRFDFEVGPRASLIYHGCCGWDWEVGYFGIDTWEARTQVPTGNYLVPGINALTGGMAPAGLVFTDRSEVYVSELYSGEINVRRRCHCRPVTLLAGFRWVKLNERATITLAGTSNVGNVDGTVQVVGRNDLFGFQIGAETILWQKPCCPWSIETVVKAGVYGNHGRNALGFEFNANGTPILSDVRNQHETHTAFVGEAALRLHYRLTTRLALHAGYQFLTLYGVALAPNQVSPDGDFLQGVDFDDGIIYQGATAGLRWVY